MAQMLGDAVLTDADVFAFESVEEPTDDSWAGDAALSLTAADAPDAECRYDPCSFGATATVELAQVLVRGGGQAMADDEGFDCPAYSETRDNCESKRGFNLDPADFILDGRVELAVGWRLGDESESGMVAWHITTTVPATLHVAALGLDRTADVTMEYEAWWDGFGGHFNVAGTVDGMPSGYDWYFTD